MKLGRDNQSMMCFCRSQGNMQPRGHIANILSYSPILTKCVEISHCDWQCKIELVTDASCEHKKNDAKSIYNA